MSDTNQQFNAHHLQSQGTTRTCNLANSHVNIALVSKTSSMFNHQFIAFIVTLLTLLNGCSMDPEQESLTLAMPKSKIESLNPETKKQYIAVYRNNQSAKRATQLHSQMSGGDTISVTISKGLARMHPNYQSERVKPMQFTLRGNQCDTIQIQSKESKKFSLLSACYLNNQLYIDESSTNEHYPVGSLIIPIPANFAAQEFCEVKTKGNAQLMQACLSISTNTTDSTKPKQRLTKARKNKGFTAKVRQSESISSDSLIQYET